MGYYNSQGGKATIANSTTIIGVSQPASALKQLKLVFIQLGSSATADNAFLNIVRRTTAAGTSTSFTPQRLDSSDGAASAVSGFNHSVEPTYTAGSELLSISGHQRLTYQWWAAPDMEFVIPVTNNAGIGLQTSTVSSGFQQSAVLQWAE